MRTRFIAIITVGIIALTLVNNAAANALLSFIFGGVIPGTHVAIPYWAMMAAYCMATALIVSRYLEIGLAYLHKRKSSATRMAKMPRRRYSAL